MHNSFASQAVIKLFLLLSIIPSTVFSQIKIVSPTPRAVYQRDVTGQREINISGTFDAITDKIEVRAIPVAMGQGIERPWKDLQLNPKGGVFSGNITLYGGWYSIEVRATLAGKLVGKDVLDRLGVGEVFLIAGQSNAQGLKAFPGPGAKDDRVTYISNYINDSKDFLTDPPRAGFSKLDDGVVFVGPRGQTPWCWGILGDMLAKKLNVPVLFINTAWEGSAVENWAKSALGEDTWNYYSGGPPNGYKFPTLMPFANLRIAAKTYANQYGLRSILWMQGEADALFKTTTASYKQSLQTIIDKLGEDIGTKKVIWVIARTSRTADANSRNVPVLSPAVVAAQNAVIETPSNPTYPGPETDDLYPYRGGLSDGTHFVGDDVTGTEGTKAALTILANAWNDIFDAKFFATVAPIAPAVVPPLNAECVPENNAVTISLPDGYAEYLWNTGETSRSIRVTAAGTYFAVVKDNTGASTITSTVVLNTDATPLQPTILPQGLQQACADSGMVFSIAGSDIYDWYKEGGSTVVASGDSVTIRESGNYTVKAQNIFGCVSDFSAASSLIVHEKLSKPVVESSGPFSITAHITETGLDPQFRWQRPGFESDTIADVVKVLKTGTYSAQAMVLFTLGDNLLTCYSETGSHDFETVEKNDVVFYPNPGNGDYIYFESRDNISNATVTVYDIFGRILTTQQISLVDGQIPVKIKNLTNGKYIVRVNGQGITLTKQIVVR